MKSQFVLGQITILLLKFTFFLVQSFWSKSQVSWAKHHIPPSRGQSPKKGPACIGAGRDGAAAAKRRGGKSAGDLPRKTWISAQEKNIFTI